MGQLIEGTWRTEDHFPTNDDGAFKRGRTTFRDAITADASSGFAAEADRYHLYVSYACPWAHRVLVSRALYGLEDAISVSVSHPLMLDNGWVFSEDKAEVGDPVLGVDYLWEVYKRANPGHTGRATVPVLWDKKKETIVNNESRELIRMLSTQFSALHKRDANLCPPELVASIDAAQDAIYSPINNGVYRCGFARSQGAYDEAVAELFSALDHWESVLSKQRFMCGEQLTEADICLFTTLVRFDQVYVTHFKCNIRRIVDYPNLWGFTRDIYQTPGVAETCRFDHIKNHYFGSHESVNPSRIVPAGPAIDFDTPHGRG